MTAMAGGTNPARSRGSADLVSFVRYSLGTRGLRLARCPRQKAGGCWLAGIDEPASTSPLVNAGSSIDFHLAFT